MVLTFENSMVQIYPIVVGRLQTNCYIVHWKDEAIVVDPGDETERILSLLKDLRVNPKLIVATHTHFDHVLGVDALRAKTHAPFAIHKDDLPLLEVMQERVQKFMGFRVPPPKLDRTRFASYTLQATRPGVSASPETATSSLGTLSSTSLSGEQICLAETSTRWSIPSKTSCSNLMMKPLFTRVTVPRQPLVMRS